MFWVKIKITIDTRTAVQLSSCDMDEAKKRVNFSRDTVVHRHASVMRDPSSTWTLAYSVFRICVSSSLRINREADFCIRFARRPSINLLMGLVSVCGSAPAIRRNYLGASRWQALAAGLSRLRTASGDRDTKHETRLFLWLNAGGIPTAPACLSALIMPECGRD